MSMKPAGIEPATFRFVAQHLNHCATAVPYECTVAFTYSVYEGERTEIHLQPQTS